MPFGGIVPANVPPAMSVSGGGGGVSPSVSGGGGGSTPTSPSSVTPGIVGDDVFDDTANLQSLVNSAPAGTVLDLPMPRVKIKITAPILVTTPNVTIRGTRGTIVRQATALTEIFKVTAPGVRITGVKMIGGGAASQSRNGAAIRALGTVAAPLTDLLFDNNEITDANYGVLLQYCDRVAVRENRVSNVWYAGVMGESCTNVQVNENVIENIIGNPNGYGVSATRTAGFSTAVEPLSQRWQIFNNRITGIAAWTGIDTHAGVDIDIYGNIIRDCAYGINMGSDSDNNPPVRCNAWGNKVLVGGATSSGGITCSGNPTNKSVDCSIVGNHVDGHGTSGSSTGAAVWLIDSIGGEVRDNKITNSLQSAIVLYGTNTGVLVIGNKIRGITAAGPMIAAIKIESGVTTGSIKDNDIDCDGSTAIRAAATQDVFVEGNRISTTSLHYHLDPSFFRRKARNRGVRKLAVAAAFTPDAGTYENFHVTLQATPINVNAPTAATNRFQEGDRITFLFIQDATGARAVTWNAIFKKTWSDVGNAAGKKSTITFEYDGTDWVQVGAQSAYN